MENSVEIAPVNGTDPQLRGANGRFLRGTKGGPGRPVRDERERLDLAAELRRQLKRYKLVPDKLVAMARGSGDYERLPVMQQFEVLSASVTP